MPSTHDRGQAIDFNTAGLDPAATSAGNLQDFLEEDEFFEPEEIKHILETVAAWIDDVDSSIPYAITLGGLKGFLRPRIEGVKFDPKLMMKLANNYTYTTSASNWKIQPF